MESSTFLVIIEKIADELRKTGATIYSLSCIINEFDHLSLVEKLEQNSKIEEIKKTVQTFGKFVEKELTFKQINRILGILESKKQIFVPKIVNYNTEYDNYSQTNNPSSKLSYEYNNNSQPNNPSSKLDSNDIIFSVVMNFLSNINRNVLASTLTTFVVEYIDTINLITEDNKYYMFTSQINICLKNHGWDFSNDGGFCKEPNRILLVNDIQKIINESFLF